MIASLHLPRRGRLLAVALLLGAIWIACAVVIEPIVSYVGSLRFEYTRSMHQLVKLQAFVSAEPEMHALLDRVSGHLLWNKVYRDTSVSAAQSSLQKDFRDITDAQKTKLENLQPIDPVTKDE